MLEINAGSNRVPRYVSYSRLSSWLSCGKRYELEKLAGVVEVPAWYFVGGSAVHQATEDFDRARFKAGLG